MDSDERFRGSVESLIAVAASYLSQFSLGHEGALTENALVRIAARNCNFKLRRCLAELYRRGHFGQRDVVAGYAWTLAACDCHTPSYDEHFRLAEIQQYYEFFLTEGECAEGIRRVEELLPVAEPRTFVPGTPFNTRWWGWEDDPIPARPGERDFKEGLILWLQAGGYSPGEVDALLARCPPSDGPTRSERINAFVDERLRSQGYSEDPVTGRWKRQPSE